MVFAENLPSRMDFSAPLIVKKIIYADSRKNNSIFAAAILATKINSGITARTPRANTAETIGHNGAPTTPPHPTTTKNSGRLAMIIA